MFSSLSTLRGLQLAFVALVTGSAALPVTAASFQFKQYAPQLAPGAPAPAPAPVLSALSDGTDTTGACATGAASGCPAAVTLQPGSTTFYTNLASTAVASGKWYWEATFIRASTTSGMVGVAAAAPASNNYIGNTPQGVDYFGYNGQYHVAGAFKQGTLTSPAVSGDTVGVALDQDARTIKFYKNCVLLASFSLPGSAAPLRPGYSGYGSANPASVDKVAVNYGTQNFRCAPPAGYNRGIWG